LQNPPIKQTFSLHEKADSSFFFLVEKQATKADPVRRMKNKHIYALPATPKLFHRSKTKSKKRKQGKEGDIEMW
jgi:hypothetical protein